MNIIAIEGRTFEQIKQRFEDFAKQIKIICGDSLNNEKWLDNKTVCELLHVSPRTLQSYRDNGTLPYSQIGHKCYYKASDIENLINESQSKK